jgi:hypothetical protein
MKHLMRIAMAVGLPSIPTLVAAQSSPTDGDEHHHGPSPGSIAACKTKSEGDACEHDARQGHESGNCRKVRSGDLACLHPHHHQDSDTGTP